MSNHVRICNGPYCQSVYATASPERLTEVSEHQTNKGNTSEVANFCLQVCARLRPAVIDELDVLGVIEAHVLVGTPQGTVSGVVIRTSHGNLINKKV